MIWRRAATEPCRETGRVTVSPMLVTIREHTILTNGLGPGATVVDLGANRGEFSREVVSRFGSRCIAVEAHSGLAAAITTGPSVSVRHLAVGGRDGVSDFHVSDDPESSGLFAAAGGTVVRTEQVREVTFDTFLAEQGLDAVELVKVDIEGAEKPLFEAASDDALLRAAQFSVEFHDFAGLVSPEDVERIVRRLRGLGFQGVRVTRTNYNWLFFQPRRCGVGRIEALATRYVERNARYVARNARRMLRAGGRSSSS